MNAAFLLMSSAALAGADVTPPPATPAPVVVSTGAGCNNCGTPAPAASCGCEKTKVGLFDKLKSKFGGFGKKSSSDCGCVPACAPMHVPPPAPCHTCNTCPTSVADRPNLFDKLKSRMGHKKASTCGPVCDPCGAAHLSPGGCATPGAPYVPPSTGGTIPPKEMPKDPKEKPKDPIKPKGDANVPLPPVSGAGGLTGTGSPY